MGAKENTRKDRRKRQREEGGEKEGYRQRNDERGLRVRERKEGTHSREGGKDGGGCEVREKETWRGEVKEKGGSQYYAQGNFYHQQLIINN